MKKHDKKLTFLEASSLIMGSGVGGGIMAVPFLASMSGFLPFIAVLALALGINIFIHLMLLEVMFRDGRNSQLVELIRRYVFTGRTGLPLLWLFFSVLLLSFVANLSAYIAGGGDILYSLFGIPLILARFLVYSVTAGVVFFGLKIVGRFEHLAFYGIVIFILVIIISAVPASFSVALAVPTGAKAVLALYGMGKRIAWFLATFPPFILALTGVLGFVEALRVAGGAVALILVFITIPMYVRAKRMGSVDVPGWSLKNWTHPIVLAVVTALIVAMAVGSLLAV